MKKWPILLNESYGPFQYSQWAVDHFNVRNKLKDPSAKRKTNLEVEDTRSHPIMIQIVSELGQEASGPDSKIVIKYVPKPFYRYVLIENYDGYEVLDYDLTKYKLDLIQQISQTYPPISAEEKIIQIENILNSDFRPWLY